jgi:predicted amidohydrolase YtcJ
MKRLVPLLLSLVPFALFADTADTVLLHGKVYTGDPAHFAQAIAIRGRKILAVGSDAEIAAMADHSTAKLDLNGAVVIPGLNDAHAQITPKPEGMRLTTVDTATFDDVRAALEWISGESPAEMWIDGVISPEVLRDPQMTAAFLDKVTGHHRVMLETSSGHAGVWSESALTSIRAGSMSDPAGGWYGHDAQGRIDGKAYEYAHFILKQKLADSASDEDAQEAVRQAAGAALVHGVTTLQSVSILPYSRFHRAVSRAGVPVRIREMELVIPGQPSNASHPTAYVVDGTPLERTAAISGIYSGTKDENGKVNFTADQLGAFLNATKQAAQQPLFDVAGDRAARILLDAIGTAAVDPATRLRIERGDGLSGDLLPRAAKAGVVVVATPSRFGMRSLYPQPAFLLKSIVANRIPLAFGSDGSANPFAGIEAAMNNGAESLTVAQALEAYTAGSAYAEMTEKDKGTLAAGKVADLAVLSQDIFKVASSTLQETRAVMTMIDGRVVSGSLAPVQK